MAQIVWARFGMRGRAWKRTPSTGIPGLAPGRTKRPRAALHDAILLRWVEQERQTSANGVWILTRDTIVMGWRDGSRSGVGGSYGVSLDALLQWISPVAMHAGLEDEFASIFADIVAPSKEASAAMRSANVFELL